MTPRTKALIARSVLGLLLVELPVVTYQLAQPEFDYRVLAVGLLGAAAAYLEKSLSPQLADTILTDAVTVTPAPKAGGS